MIEFLQQPWPWYVAGPMIGLTVPLLLIIGNKRLGVSSSLRHICAVCTPVKIPFFNYDWKKEVWNLFFVGGTLVGGIIATAFLINRQPMTINPDLVSQFSAYGINDLHSSIPSELFNWQQLLTARGLVMIVGGGFMVGFGTRYAGGCTSGHSIMGLSNLQLPSLIATICFMAGGYIMSNLLLPFILKL